MGLDATPGERDRATSFAYLPVVLAATATVVVLPLVLVVWLRAQGLLTSAWAGVLVGIAGSLIASFVGAALWKRAARSGDVLFSDLMLWGWLHRRRSARRVTAATALLASRHGESSAISGRTLSNERKTALLAGLIGNLESRDPYTHGHSRRVARHAADIARQMGLDRPTVAKIRAAGAVHDVGKIHTPPEILNKPGKLTAEEFAVIERHPVDGTEMVSVLGDPELAAIVRHHHERLDGNGYPDGIGGEEIPLGARILAVADTFDAITSFRPYRRAHTHEEALRILADGAGTQHDPDAVRAFERCYSGWRPLALWAGVVNAFSRVTPAVAANMGAGGAGAGAGAVGGGAGAGAAGAWIAAATVAVGGVGISAGGRTAVADPVTAEASAAVAPAPGASGRSRSGTTSSSGAAAKRKARAGQRGTGTTGAGGAASPDVAAFLQAVSAAAGSGTAAAPAPAALPSTSPAAPAPAALPSTSPAAAATGTTAPAAATAGAKSPGAAKAGAGAGATGTAGSASTEPAAKPPIPTGATSGGGPGADPTVPVKKAK